VRFVPANGVRVGFLVCGTALVEFLVVTLPCSGRFATVHPVCGGAGGRSVKSWEAIARQAKSLFLILAFFLVGLE